MHFYVSYERDPIEMSALQHRKILSVDVPPPPTPLAPHFQEELEH